MSHFIFSVTTSKRSLHGRAGDQILNTRDLGVRQVDDPCITSTCVHRLVGGLEHLLSFQIYRRIIPTD